MVAVSPETQLKRLMARDKSAQEEAQKRIDSQMPLADKVAKADIVIQNDGTPDELNARVVGIVTDLQGALGWSRLFNGPALMAALAAIVGWVVMPALQRLA